MRKTLWFTVTVVLLVAVHARAEKCDYHQWRMDTCSGLVAGMPAQKCDYYQWPKADCEPVAPVVRPVAVAPVEEKIVLRDILFDFDKSTIREVSYPKLDRAVDALKDKPGKDITVAGHTDSIGTEAYNQKLSEARAKSVTDYFVSKGIEADRIRAVGMGESAPEADNTTSEGRALNRRIELTLR